MLERFVFSDGQALGTLDSTGVVSSNVWDLETYAVADGQVMGWVNVVILSTTNTAGDEGLNIAVLTDAAAALTTAPKQIGGIILVQSEILAAAAGIVYSIGIKRDICEQYLGVWYKAVSTSLNLLTSVDAWFSDQPLTRHGIQKKNASTGAS
jgi:hypothetical protein